MLDRRRSRPLACVSGDVHDAGMQKDNAPAFDFTESINTTVSKVSTEESIVWHLRGVEKLRIEKDGFFVDGRAVDIGNVERHDQEVYRAFREWLDGARVDLRSPEERGKDIDALKGEERADIVRYIRAQPERTLHRESLATEIGDGMHLRVPEKHAEPVRDVAHHDCG